MLQEGESFHHFAPAEKNSTKYSSTALTRAQVPAAATQHALRQQSDASRCSRTERDIPKRFQH